MPQRRTLSGAHCNQSALSQRRRISEYIVASLFHLLDYSASLCGQRYSVGTYRERKQTDREADDKMVRREDRQKRTVWILLKRTRILRYILRRLALFSSPREPSGV